MSLPRRLNKHPNCCESGLGTASTVGYFSAISLFSIFLAGLSFPWLTRKLQGFFSAFGILLYGLGFLLETLAHSAWMAALAVFLLGFGQGLFFPMSFNKTAQMVPKGRMTTAISILLACIYLGQFVSPVFMSGIFSIFHFTTYREAYMLLAAVLGVCMIISLLFVKKRQVKQSAQ